MLLGDFALFLDAFILNCPAAISIPPPGARTRSSPENRTGKGFQHRSAY